MSTPLLVLVPPQVAHQEYVRWHTERGLDAPPLTEHGIFVAESSSGVILAGVGIYETTSAYALVEHFATNPDAPTRLVNLATRFMIGLLRSYGAMRGKYMLMVTSSRSIASMLRRYGAFEKSKGIPLYATPVAQLTFETPKKGKRKK